MTLANVVRDAVAAFEIYAGKALDEILNHHSKARVTQHKDPHWPILVGYYRTFGIDISPARVTHVRDLRHLLTHNRGELRTAEQRKQFADSQDTFARDIAALSPKTVLEHLDVLGAATRQIDPVMWACTFSYDGLGRRLTAATDGTVSIRYSWDPNALQGAGAADVPRGTQDQRGYKPSRFHSWGGHRVPAILGA